MTQINNTLNSFIQNKLNKNDITKLLLYQGKIITFSSDVYTPSYDTKFFINHLKINKNEKILDLGTGTGILSIFCADSSNNITATDCSKKALSCAQLNAKLNNVSNKIKFKLGSWFKPIKDEKFDLILSDPPQQPTPYKKKFSELVSSAYDAGPRGRDALDILITEGINHLCPKGKIIIYHAQFANINKSIKLAKKVGYSKVKIIARGQGEFGRTSGERINYFKSIGINIKTKNGKPILSYYLLQLTK
ncbi:MAG: methyltransferase [Sphaerochaetaceae bacterium]|nr:methyltransferase [Sphaerochaetaceae bacterium]